MGPLLDSSCANLVHWDGGFALLGVEILFDLARHIERQGPYVAFQGGSFIIPILHICPELPCRTFHVAVFVAFEYQRVIVLLTFGLNGFSSECHNVLKPLSHSHRF